MDGDRAPTHIVAALSKMKFPEGVDEQSALHPYAKFWLGSAEWLADADGMLGGKPLPTAPGFLSELEAVVDDGVAG